MLDKPLQQSGARRTRRARSGPIGELPSLGVSSGDRPLILHVTEALGGGISSALSSFVAATFDEFDHALVYSERSSHRTGDGYQRFAYLRKAPGGRFGLARVLNATIRALRPDVVHAHSSWAGLIARLPGLAEGVPVVYSPHCFAFERTSSPAAINSAARLAERALAVRTTVAACVSPHEEELARALGARAAFVPNVVLADQMPPRGTASAEVVTIGRISDQKDPDYFRAVVAEYREAFGDDLSFTWIGDGPPESRWRLERASVEVTGWLGRRATLDRLASACAYLHTAAWEGSPMSILEAEACGVPVVARSIPSLVSLGHPAALHAPRDVARALHGVCQSGSGNPRAQTKSLADQREALVAVYGMAMKASLAAAR